MSRVRPRLWLPVALVLVCSPVCFALTAEVHFKDAYQFQLLHNYKEAIAEYGRAIDADEDYYRAYVNRGIAYADTGEYGKAVVDLTRAIVLKPDRAQYYYFRACCYVRMDDCRRALEDLDKAIFAQPKFADSYYVRAQIFQKGGRRKEALEDYRQFILLSESSSDKEARSRIAGVRERMKELSSRIEGP